MYKIAVIGDYDSIYGFATLGLSICPVKTREEASDKLKQLAAGKYGIIYITEAVAAELKEEIEKRGGKVTGSVTSKTHYLINNDTTSNSSKNKKAKELGIPILSEDDFIKMAGM